MLAVPAANLYTREVNKHIAIGIKSKTDITITNPLKDELLAWTFFDNWTGKLEWKKERHLKLGILTDA